MDKQKLNERVKRIAKYIVSEKINNEDLKTYIGENSDIDGETIRSYFIVYCDGIKDICRELVSLYKEEYITAEFDFNIMAIIEEALEEVNFDNMFERVIKDIKNS